MVLVSCSLESKSSVCLLICNAFRRFAVSLDRRVVPANLFCRDTELPHLRVEPESRPGARISIHKTDSRVCDITDLLHAFGVSLGKHKPLGTVCQRDDFHFAIRKKMTDKRSVVFPAFIQEMRSRDLAKSLAKVDESIQRANRQT